ncbi:SubName: Full=Uncharacterized protein {ECO:0000313/EMBL:CCA77842.1} [Serendipita indica DSM 11827]|nr:SubName: Full=Uncharacterized protein {ECO:0000313/EMBL:CCA77842.1} [Serendipita indica DSM 11827]
MPLLTNPSRPKPPRYYKQRQAAHRNSESTLRDEPDEALFEDDMDASYAPPVPPKLDMSYTHKDVQQPEPVQLSRRATFRGVPPSPIRPSTSNRWKAAVGRILMLKRTPTKPRHLTPPPVSPASSRMPSFYTPQGEGEESRMHRSAVTLLTSASSTQNGHDDPYGGDDDDNVTDIMGAASVAERNPVTPITLRQASPIDYLEPISSVLQRATPSPVTPVIYTPISPIYRSASATPLRNTTPSSSASRMRKQSTKTLPRPIPTPSPPPFVWPSPQLIVANPTPTSTPPPPPIQIKKATMPRAINGAAPAIRGRPRANTVDALPPMTAPQKKAGPRILQAQLPAPVAPDPKNHVFIGPWHDRKGREWLGLSATPGEYKVKEPKPGQEYDPKYINYPDEPDLFMNERGDVMNAKTLKMVAKAARLG